MKKFRIKLTAIFIALVGFSVLAAGLFAGEMMKHSHIAALKENLFRELNIIRATVEWKTDENESGQLRYYERMAESLKQSADARVTFIRADGKVLGDSDFDAAQMDNHLHREEIEQARLEGAGYSIRYSDTIKRNMLYVAVPVGNDAGRPDGYIRLAMSLRDLDAAVQKLWSGLLYGLLFLFALAGFISYRIARGLTRPLEKMMRVAQQITDMNYEARVRIRSNDEIGLLGQAINTMADSLQRQMNRISEDESRLKNVLDNMNSGVVMIDRNDTIVLLNRAAEEMLGAPAAELLGRGFGALKQHAELTELIGECMKERRYIREELMFYYPEERIVEIHLAPLANAGGESAGIVIVLHDITAIRRLERVRSEFVANVSHELKTPISAVKGFAETLLAGAMNDPETAESFLRIILDESDRLDRLIGDILELSKIESKRVQLRFSPIHMSSFVSKTIDMLRAESAKKGIALQMDVAEDMYVEADEDRLRQILLNLLSNGINYTPDGGTVKVSAEPIREPGQEDYDKVRIIVSDTGIGIPKKDLPRIFERFYRVDKARSRSSGGTGLGLSIVKHLVELHKGSIRVESEAGAGSKFIIELPVIQ